MRCLIPVLQCLAANLCHDWLIHLWVCVLDSVSVMARMRLQGVNDFLSSAALCYCVVKDGKLRRPLVRLAVTYQLLVHGILFVGQSVRIPFVYDFVLAFYPDTVVNDGGFLHSAYNLLRYIAVRTDLVFNTYLSWVLAQTLL